MIRISCDKRDDQPGVTLDDLAELLEQARKAGYHGYDLIRFATASIVVDSDGPYAKRVTVVSNPEGRQSATVR